MVAARAISDGDIIMHLGHILHVSNQYPTYITEMWSRSGVKRATQASSVRLRFLTWMFLLELVVNGVQVEEVQQWIDVEIRIWRNDSLPRSA